MAVNGGSGLVSSRPLDSIAQGLGLRKACRACRQNGGGLEDLVFCDGCHSVFHRSCWPQYEDHKDNDYTSSPCQTFSDLELHIWLTHLHNPSCSTQDLLHNLYNDRYHRWIGLSIQNPSAPSAPELQVYAALTKLFTDVDGGTFRSLPRRQFPRIVSFIGDSGTGKSTVIQNLIRIIDSETKFEVPVVGSSSASEMSTSGGIHAYTDPSSFGTETPLVYIDCEGLNGDTWPLGNSLVATTDNGVRNSSPSASLSRTTTQRTFTRLASHMLPLPLGRAEPEEPHKEMPLPIASVPLPWTEARNDRSYVTSWIAKVVDKIYPRFLYIFSDVICYVTGNLRSSENDLGRLVDWAHDAHGLTANQPVKPKLIYIVNQDPNADFTEWANSQIATTKLLEKWRKCPRFLDLQKLWRSRGERVDNADQLLRCYYSGVIVVFIPQFKPRRQVCGAEALQGQYQKLYQEIDHQSHVAAGHRKRASLGFSLETISRLSIAVLEQLGADPLSPVDLRSLTEPAERYPTDFKDHVLNILTRLQKVSPFRGTRNYEESLCQNFSEYLAVCATLEIWRTKSQHGSEDSLIQDLEKKWTEILETFDQTQCRCEEESYGARCKNFGNTHGSGHHFDLKGDGRFKPGEFQSSFAHAMPRLRTHFSSALKRQLNRSTGRRRLDLETPARLSTIDRVFSNRSCLTCFTRTPTIILPCRHVLCDQCGIEFGSRASPVQADVSIDNCPLGCQWRLEQVKIQKKPSAAGVRILSLDGGGVRGVIELAILEAITSEVGHDIPLQELFDFIIGTSTGGIIALGLFKRKWSLREASNLFVQLAKQAFRARTSLKLWWRLPGAHITRKLVCEYIYRSQEIEAALKQAFGEETRLFGYTKNDGMHTAKIAVVAVGDEAQRVCLLTDYNREWRLNDENNSVQREEQPEDEMKIWEVARSTSAAPTYFEKYTHPTTKRTYTDGAMLKNNPVSLADNERRFLWPGQAEQKRDLVLSIGTGYAANYDGSPRKSQFADLLKPLRQIGLVANIALIRLVIENTLDCQKMWRNFKESLGPDKQLLSKCHRLNVPFGPGLEPCDLDDIDAMPKMKDEAAKYLDMRAASVFRPVQEETNIKIKTIARQLIATLFYLSVQELSDYSPSEVKCRGSIVCRLSNPLEAQFQSLTKSMPMFRIREENNIESSSLALNGQWDRKNFSIDCHFVFSKTCSDVTLQLSMDSGKHWEDMSGFPRDLRTTHRVEDENATRRSTHGERSEMGMPQPPITDISELP